MLELQDKVQKIDSFAPSQKEGHSCASSGILDDVASALVNLGYKEAVVKKALAEIEITADASTETVLKQALKSLMK